MADRIEPIPPRVARRRTGRGAGAEPAAGPHFATGTRRYMAAGVDRLVGRFGSLMGVSMRAETRQSLRGLVAHARYAAQNIDYLRSYEMMVRRHVVGKNGITLQMDARDPDGSQDDIANAMIEAAWARWGKRGNCTICGRLSWWNVENVAATMIAREGNFLLRLHHGARRGPFGFQVEVLPIDLLDIDRMARLGGGRHIDGGIEYDTDGRPLAFHLFPVHPAETHAGAHGATRRIPADQIVHVYRPSEGGQALGVPASHTALRRFNMLGQYEGAALAAAHYGAAAMLVLESEGESAEAPGTGPGGPPIDEIEAGSVLQLDPGVKASQWSPSYPNGDMPDFTKAMLRGGAAGLGVSYAGLTSDMEGANFSSLRDGRGEERDEWRMFQRDLFEGLHSQIFARWLPAALASGALRLPWAKLEKWQAATWRPRGWQSVNPKDDATANAADLANRLRAPSDIVAERGEDFEAVVRRTARDLATLKAAGLPVPEAMAPRPVGRPPAPAEPDKPAEDQE